MKEQGEEAREKDKHSGRKIKLMMVMTSASMPRRTVTHWNFLILTLFSWQDFQTTELFFPFVPGGVSKRSGPVNK